jgi:hypothetical protein
MYHAMGLGRITVVGSLVSTAGIFNCRWLQNFESRSCMTAIIQSKTRDCRQAAVLHASMVLEYIRDKSSHRRLLRVIMHCSEVGGKNIARLQQERQWIGPRSMPE